MSTNACTSSDIAFSHALMACLLPLRCSFQMALVDIFKHFNETYERIEGRLSAENFKQKVMNCFRIWEEWVIYPFDHLIKCQNIFLGLLQAVSSLIVPY